MISGRLDVYRKFATQAKGRNARYASRIVDSVRFARARRLMEKEEEEERKVKSLGLKLGFIN